jgi:hypothetical protein
MPALKQSAAAIRSIEVRIRLTPELSHQIVETHLVFNQAVRELMQFYERLRHAVHTNDVGIEPDLGRRQHLRDLLWVVEHVLEAYQLPDLLNKASSAETRSDASARKIADGPRAAAAKQIERSRRKLGELEEQIADLRTELEQANARQAAAVTQRLARKERARAEVARQITAAEKLFARLDGFIACLDDFATGWLPLAPVIGALKERLPAGWVHWVVDQAFQAILSHRRLRQRWNRYRRAMRDGRLAFERAHPGYMAERERIRALITRHAGTKRVHWNQLLGVLGAQPRRSAWHDSGPRIAGVSTRAGALQNGELRVLAEAFRGQPELAALLPQHGEYEKLRAKVRRERPPTLTLPTLGRPRFLALPSDRSANWGYRRFAPPSLGDNKVPGHAVAPVGSLELKLLAPTGRVVAGRQVYRNDSVLVTFDGDKRFRSLIRSEKPLSFVYRSPRTGYAHRGEFGGVRLRVAGTCDENDVVGGKRVRACLDFALRITPAPPSRRARRFRPAGIGGEGRVQPAVVPEGLVASIFQIDSFGFVVALQVRCHADGRIEILRQKEIDVEPTLMAIASKQALLAEKTQTLGRIPKDRPHHRRLTTRIRNMMRHRRRNGVDAMLRFALGLNDRRVRNPGRPVRSDIIVVQDLRGFIPRKCYGPEVNTQIRNIGRGMIVEQLKNAALIDGLRVIEPEGRGADLVCSNCSDLGHRFSWTNITTTDGRPRPLQPGDRRPENLTLSAYADRFCCTACGRTTSGTRNTLLNLLLRAIRPEHFQQYDAFARHPKERRDSMMDEVREHVVARLIGPAT